MSHSPRSQLPSWARNHRVHCVGALLGQANAQPGGGENGHLPSFFKLPWKTLDACENHQVDECGISGSCPRNSSSDCDNGNSMIAAPWVGFLIERAPVAPLASSKCSDPGKPFGHPPRLTVQSTSDLRTQNLPQASPGPPNLPIWCHAFSSAAKEPT